MAIININIDDFEMQPIEDRTLDPTPLDDIYDKLVAALLAVAGDLYEKEQSEVITVKIHGDESSERADRRVQSSRRRTCARGT